MTLEEFKFRPDKIEVKAGKVEFAVSNKGAIEHDFHIVEGKDLDREDKRLKPINMQKGHKDHAIISPGKTERFTYELKVGTYTIICSIPGHKEAGMTALLVVK